MLTAQCSVLTFLVLPLVNIFFNEVTLVHSNCSGHYATKMVSSSSKNQFGSRRDVCRWIQSCCKNQSCLWAQAWLLFMGPLDNYFKRVRLFLRSCVTMVPTWRPLRSCAAEPVASSRVKFAVYRTRMCDGPRRVMPKTGSTSDEVHSDRVARAGKRDFESYGLHVKIETRNWWQIGKGA